MESVVLLPTTSGQINVIGAPQHGAGFTNFLGGSHTISISVTNFTGRIYIEASLATLPCAEDWFPVIIQNQLPWIQFPQDMYNPTGPEGGDTDTVAFSFAGNYVWIRARVNRDYLSPAPIDPTMVGSVDEILLNFGTLGGAASSSSLSVTGPRGPIGPQGIPGSSASTGPTGPGGLPRGGQQGQIISKIDNSDYNVAWTNKPLVIAQTGPSSPMTGDLWWNSSDGNQYVYFNSAWVPSMTTLVNGGSNIVPPTTSIGRMGDLAGQVAYDANYIYYCKTNYTNGLTNIWVRVAFSQTPW
jgi:hypothetical protein